MLNSSDCSNVKVVLLAGGLGTRIREETTNKPKPMIEVGGYPLLWHSMKNFGTFGINKFVICTGYRSEVIVDYFANLLIRTHDFTIDYGNGSEINIHSDSINLDWKVTIVNTGDSKVGTGGRLYRVRQHLTKEPFICTYGDGLADVNIAELLKFHAKSNTIATMTVTQPENRFGVAEVSEGMVKTFKEKPKVDGWINSGYFVFNNEIWDYLDSNCALEEKPLQDLASQGQISAFKHSGFWQAMDTYREYELLQKLWESGKAPWKNWE
jgi:glucose-1-phosphate cytidylyltransferase